MRIVGIGIDVENIESTKTSIARYGSSWLRRQFTNFEIERASAATLPPVYFTSLFAVKEAVSKAVGHGIDDDLPILSMQVTFTGAYVESIVFLPPATELLANLKVSHVKASVTVLGNHVIASAIAED